MLKTVADLSLSESGIIKEIHLEEPKYFKAFHLGVQKGNKITCLFKSPFKDPIAYKINGCVFTLRKIDAEKIWVSAYE